MSRVPPPDCTPDPTWMDDPTVPEVGAPSDPDSAEEAFPILLGRYELVGVLGRGGMGEVYRARDLDLGRDVAVKRMWPGPRSEVLPRARFRQEARALARARHPSLVEVLGFVDDPTDPHLVMRLVEGPSLQERLKAGPLSPRVALHVARDLARALDALHSAGVLHCDVKPANILLEPHRRGAPRPVLVDLGLARDLHGDELERDLPEGTTAYMAPEQLASDRGPMGPWTDQYSLGIVLYEMISGRHPFGKNQERSALSRRLAAPPPLRFPWAASAAQEVVKRALSPHPADRFPDLEAMARALGRAARALQGRERPRRRLPRARTALPVAALGAAAGALMVTTAAPLWEGEVRTAEQALQAGAGVQAPAPLQALLLEASALPVVADGAAAAPSGGLLLSQPGVGVRAARIAPDGEWVGPARAGAAGAVQAWPVGEGWVSSTAGRSTLLALDGETLTEVASWAGEMPTPAVAAPGAGPPAVLAVLDGVLHEALVDDAGAPGPWAHLPDLGSGAVAVVQAPGGEGRVVVAFGGDDHPGLTLLERHAGLWTPIDHLPLAGVASLVAPAEGGLAALEAAPGAGLRLHRLRLDGGRLVSAAAPVGLPGGGAGEEPTLAAADLDGDGASELVVGRPGVALHVVSAAGSRVETVPGWWPLAVGELDASAGAELIVAEAGGGAWVLGMGDGVAAQAPLQWSLRRRIRRPDSG